jgi:autotransporter-associated beta strand protein
MTSGRRWTARGWRGICRLLAAATPVALPSIASAQFSNKVSTTPNYIQDGFGSSGQELGDDGLNYCCPVSAAMSLAYLGENGFNQVGPANPTIASGLNLVDVLGGLMQTTPLGGTASVSNITAAFSTYLAAEGISPSQYTLTLTSKPTMSQLTSLNQPGSVVDLIAGYYGSSNVREGGHCVALDAEGINVEGQSVPDMLAFNNPLPSALSEYADTPNNSVGFFDTQTTSGTLAQHGSLELSPAQNPSVWQYQTLVLETAIALTVNTSQLSANKPTVSSWNVAIGEQINLGGGSLPVLAPLIGSTGLDLLGGGTMELKATDTGTLNNTVNDCTLRSDVATGEPVGSGSMLLQSGTLVLAPDAAGTVNYSVANSAGHVFNYANDSSIVLTPDGNNPLVVTFGGYTNGVSANFAAINSTDVLTLVPSTGNASLGAQVQVLVAGSAGNLPQNTNGIVPPSIVSEDSDGQFSGDFLTYGSTGFTVANYTTASSEPITLAGSATNYYDNLPQSIPAATTTTVNSLKVGPVVLGGGSASVLNVASGGIILNGGTISTTDLDFGGTQGFIYSSLAGGTISSVIQGSGVGVSTFGPGTTVFTGINTFNGGITVQSGVLLVADKNPSFLGNEGDATVEPNATFAVGPGNFNGEANILAGGTLAMAGGTITSTVTLGTGSFLQGSGDLTGGETIKGSIVAGTTPDNLTFSDETTQFDAQVIYQWRLNALDANPADAGINWSHLTFGDGLNFESGSDDVLVTLDLGPALPTPNSGNIFWDQPHMWSIASQPFNFTVSQQEDFDYNFPSFQQGYFDLPIAETGTENIELLYTPFAAQSASFTASGLASWSYTENWANEAVAQHVGDTATFANASTPTTVTLDGDFSVGGLVFNDTNSYTLAPGIGGTLTMDNGVAGSATITVISGAHSITAPMVLNSNTQVAMIGVPTALSLSGPIAGAGGLTMSGGGSVTLSGSNSFSGGTVVNGGVCLVGSANALPNGGNVTIGTGALVKLATNIAAPTLGTLVINSGTLDVNNAGVLLRYANVDPIASIASYLQTGYAGGAWNGTGIVSSAVANLDASQTQLIYSVGYADGADGLISGLSSGEIEILPTLVGDAKLAGNVVFGDFQVLAEYFGQSGGWDEGNFMYGAAIDFGDFQLLAQNFANSSGLTAGEMASLNSFASEFEETLTPGSDGAGFSAVSVPEPVGVGLLAVGAATVMRRRRKNC